MIRSLTIVVLTALTAYGLCAQTTPSLLQSDGVMYNTGRIVIRGDAYIAQDSIGAVVEYVRDNPADSQRVQHMTYFDVLFSGRSLKSMRTSTQNLIAANFFSSANDAVIFDLDGSSRIEVRGTVRHEGIINPGLRYGTMEFNGDAVQELSGKGLIPILEQNNPTAVSIVGGGGTRIVERLNLRKGVLDNAAMSNIVLLDNAWIWRSDVANIADVPQTDQRMNLRYYGRRPVLSGPEMLRDPAVIQRLFQDNDGGLTMAWDATVNDTMILQGHIETEFDSTRRYALTYTAAIDPRYIGIWPEVNGTLVRTNVVPGARLMMNSDHTSMRFADTASRGNVRAIQLRSRRSSVPLPAAQGTDKIRRFYQLTMLDANGQRVPDSTWTTEFGYGWRALPAPDNETNAVIEMIPILASDQDELILLRFDGATFGAEGNSVTPTQSSVPDNLWRSSWATGVRTNGDYAIGLVASTPVFVLRVRVLLEGPMRAHGDNITSVMGTELRQRNLVPSTPPVEYPYNLDPRSASILVPVMPDTIVDWMIVELRSDATGGRTYYQTVLLSQGGYLVDPLTTLPVAIANVQAGDYHVVLRHRNHLAIMTETKERISSSVRDRFIDFTSGVGLFGGASSMALLGTEGGRRLFGMVAGQTSADNSILRIDHNLVWDNRDIEGYSLFDTDLDGIISTKDWNVSWNNRERNSAVP